MIKKSGLTTLCLILFLAGTASAFTTNITNYNTTLATVNISNTTDLYAYEINFDYTGTIDSIDQNSYQFLGSGSEATYGYDDDNESNILSVYGSRLDPERIGVNNSGILFNVSHYGPISLRYTLAIYGNGTEIYTYYNTTENPGTPYTPTGGGGGGGGGGPSTPKELDVSPNLLQFQVIQGKTTPQKVKLTNLATNQIEIESIDFGGLNGLVANYLPNTPITIPLDKSIDIIFDFFASKSTPPEIYTGEIKFKTSRSEETTSVVLEVKEEEPLFDVIVTPEQDFYLPGDIATATIDIQNFGELRNVDVLVRYELKDFQGNTLIFEEGSYAIEYKHQLIGKLRIPKDTPIGEKLIFYVKVTYPQKDISATASSVITIEQNPQKSPFESASLFFLILIPLAVVAIIIVTIIIIFNVKKTKPLETHPAQNEEAHNF